METHWLTCHPDTPCPALDSVMVEVSVPVPGLLRLWFTISGQIERIALPVWEPAERRDGLWEHTCFEAFLRDGDEAAYHEYNFSPASHWAAYAFESYRNGMRNAVLGAPSVSIAGIAGRSAVGADVEMPLAIEPSSARLGFSAVIEEIDGTKSYWALAHPPGKPDFHHPACFAATLPPPIKA